MKRQRQQTRQNWKKRLAVLPEELDKALIKRARREGKSINMVICEGLNFYTAKTQLKELNITE